MVARVNSGANADISNAMMENNSKPESTSGGDLPDQKETEFQRTVEDVRRRQKYFKPTSTAGNLAAKVMTRYSVASSQASRQLEKEWEATVGPKVAADTRPGNLRRGVLEVIVSNSAIHQQLSFQKKKLVTQLQQNPQLAKIRDIRFRVGQIGNDG